MSRQIVKMLPNLVESCSKSDAILSLCRMSHGNHSVMTASIARPSTRFTRFYCPMMQLLSSFPSGNYLVRMVPWSTSMLHA